MLITGICTCDVMFRQFARTARTARTGDAYRIYTKQAATKSRGMFHERPNPVNPLGEVENWQKMFYIHRQDADNYEAEVRIVTVVSTSITFASFHIQIISFKKTYVPDEEIATESKYNALLKQAIKKGNFSKLQEAEFMLDGGTDTHWSRAIIFVAAHMPSEFVEDVSDGVVDDGLVAAWLYSTYSDPCAPDKDCKELQYIATQMDRIANLPYSIVYVATEKEGAPEILPPSCIETIFRSSSMVLLVHVTITCLSV